MKEVFFILLDITYDKDDRILSGHLMESKFTSGEIGTKKGDWLTRGNKRSQYMDYIAREDEDIFREHLEQMEKKQSKLEV